MNRYFVENYFARRFGYSTVEEPVETVTNVEVKQDDEMNEISSSIESVKIERDSATDSDEDLESSSDSQSDDGDLDSSSESSEFPVDVKIEEAVKVEGTTKRDVKTEGAVKVEGATQREKIFAARIKGVADGKKFKIMDDVFDLLENSGYDSDVESDAENDRDRTRGPLLQRHAGQILVYTKELPCCNDW